MLSYALMTTFSVDCFLYCPQPFKNLLLVFMVLFYFAQTTLEGWHQSCKSESTSSTATTRPLLFRKLGRVPSERLSMPTSLLCTVASLAWPLSRLWLFFSSFLSRIFPQTVTAFEIDCLDSLMPEWLVLFIALFMFYFVLYLRSLEIM